MSCRSWPPNGRSRLSIAPQTCGGGGVANVCGCTLVACGPTDCGELPDGCGGVLHCTEGCADSGCVDDSDCSAGWVCCTTEKMNTDRQWEAGYCAVGPHKGTCVNPWANETCNPLPVLAGHCGTNCNCYGHDIFCGQNSQGQPACVFPEGHYCIGGTPCEYDAPCCNGTCCHRGQTCVENACRDPA